MSTQVQLECNGYTQLLFLQVPQDMTQRHINEKVSEAIGLPNGSYTLSYLDDLTLSYMKLAVPEDYTELAYIAMFKGLCLSAREKQRI